MSNYKIIDNNKIEISFTNIDLLLTDKKKLNNRIRKFINHLEAEFIDNVLVDREFILKNYSSIIGIFEQKVKENINIDNCRILFNTFRIEKAYKHTSTICLEAQTGNGTFLPILQFYFTNKNHKAKLSVRDNFMLKKQHYDDIYSLKAINIEMNIDLPALVRQYKINKILSDQ